MKRFLVILTVWATALVGVLTSVVLPAGSAAAATLVVDTATSTISGRVTEAGGAHGGLENVSVNVSSSTKDSAALAFTAADGSYAVTGLEAGTDYEVCFSDNSNTTGGTLGRFGYVDQCYKDQYPSRTPTPVTVTEGATVSLIDAALTGGSALSGRVFEAAVGHRGLQNVVVNVRAAATGFSGDALTAADGTYTMTGLPAGTDYTVCFLAANATNGSSDGLRYVGQCYRDTSASGTPTPVTIAAGVAVSGIDAALAAASAAPGAPTGVSAIAGKAEAQVSWTAPAGGTTITAYTVTASAGGGSATTNGSATSATITGLINGTSYTFTVTATTLFGTSPASVQSNAVTPVGRLAPAAPKCRIGSAKARRCAPHCSTGSRMPNAGGMARGRTR